jgi:hypothetical protein
MSDNNVAEQLKHSMHAIAHRLTQTRDKLAEKGGSGKFYLFGNVPTEVQKRIYLR